MVGLVDLDLGSPLLRGQNSSYLLPKQDGGTSQMNVDPTKPSDDQIEHPALGWEEREENVCAAMKVARALKKGRKASR